MRHYRQFFKFALVGAIGFVVDAGVLYLALQAGSGYFAGRAVSFLCAVFTTWLINRQFTFSDRPEGSIVNEVARYFAAMSLGGCINYAAYSIVIVEFGPMPFLPLFAIGVGSVAGLFFNFVSAKLWIFKD